MPPPHLSQNSGLLLRAFILAGLLGVLAAVSRISPADLGDAVLKSYHFPYVNSCTVGKVAGWDLHLLVYTGTVLIAALSFVWRRRGRPGLRFSGELRASALFMFLLVAGLQVANHIRVFANERAIFHGKTTEEKNLFIHKRPYAFAEAVRAGMPGRHACGLLTDGDPQREPFMGQHRKLAYFLYPQIDIRGVRPNTPKDCLIVYDKPDAEHALPPSFRIKMRYDERSFLAVRE